MPERGPLPGGRAGRVPGAAVTPAQERWAALGCLAFGILGVYLSRRPSTDIAFGILGALGCLFFLVPSILRYWGNVASRRRVREQKMTPWTMFSEPHPTDATQWEVGIRRRTEDGVDLDRRALYALVESDELEIAVAEAECRVKATRWTRSQIGM